jgi:hypothetical protein
VMTQIGRRVGFPLHIGSGMSLILAVVLGLACPSPCDAAKLSRFLTAKDLTGRLVLDQNGQQLQLPSASDRHPEIAKGSTPTYLAIPLDGGEHLPASIPTIETGSQQGENPVGPLNFDGLVKVSLNSTLTASKLAIVDTPAQNYLVELLPGRTHGGSASDTAAQTATSTVSELSQLLNTGSTQFSKLTQSGVNDLEKFLHISSKTSTVVPSLNLEAQLLSSNASPAAVPEPGTWMIFAGLLAGAAVLQRRLPTPA